jgi:hypothetical protein
MSLPLNDFQVWEANQLFEKLSSAFAQRTAAEYNNGQFRLDLHTHSQKAPACIVTERVSDKSFVSFVWLARMSASEQVRISVADGEHFIVFDRKFGIAEANEPQTIVEAIWPSFKKSIDPLREALIAHVKTGHIQDFPERNLTLTVQTPPDFDAGLIALHRPDEHDPVIDVFWRRYDDGTIETRVLGEKAFSAIADAAGTWKIDRKFAANADPEQIARIVWQDVIQADHEQTPEHSNEGSTRDGACPYCTWADLP